MYDNEEHHYQNQDEDQLQKVKERIRQETAAHDKLEFTPVK